MEDNTKQHLKNISIAAISTIPIAGGAISVLLDKYLPEFMQRRRDIMVEEINKDLKLLQENFSNINLSDDRFISTFIKCTKLSLEEYESEKIEAYRNIILNSVIPAESDFDESTLFINWIQELTIDEIRIIKAINDIDDVVYKNVNSNDIYQLLKVVYPNLPADYLIIIGQDLMTKNIVMGKNSYRKDNNKHSERQWYLTNLGERFVKYITSPIER
ncbi:MAG: hypothetical protein GQ564_00085 [Bacteroidales bacterium]|nr:hypothetical protein [Bacteroidales bacterium]